MISSWVVRRLDPSDAALLRELRLRALAEEPTAFGSTYDREAAFDDELWVSRLQPQANPHFVAATDDGVVVGLAAGIRSDDGNAELVAMWVAPEARGSGAADALVEAVLAWARSASFPGLRLHVTEGNERAERLYERHGFRRTGAASTRERDGSIEFELELSFPR